MASMPSQGSNYSIKTGFSYKGEEIFTVMSGEVGGTGISLLKPVKTACDMPVEKSEIPSWFKFLADAPCSIERK